MSQESTPPATQIVHLAPGAQAVINGALVSAREACTLEVGAGAHVLTGRALWPAHNALRNPSDELYLSLIDCLVDEDRFFAERFRLFALLGEVAAQDQTFENQSECSQCAAALMAGDPQTAAQSAARMASCGLETARSRTRALGLIGQRRRTRHNGL
ncbi:MAG: hypothetical protein AAGH57_05165 [Pseudomonadota bacterium]